MEVPDQLAESGQSLNQLLTPEELADLLNVDVRYVYRLVNTKRFPTVHLGRRKLRFDPRDVAAWIESRKTGQ